MGLEVFDYECNGQISIFDMMPDERKQNKKDEWTDNAMNPPVEDKEEK